MKQNRSILRNHPKPRPAFTMIELLIAVGILAVLLSLTLIAGKGIMASRARSTARQQVAMISTAIDRYASFWPKWKVAGILLADRGWPDHIAGRLFNPSLYQTITGFNDTLLFDVTDGILITPDLENTVDVGDVLSANISLAYALTAISGTKSNLAVDDNQALLKDETQVIDRPIVPLLPSILGTNAAQRALVLVDPWDRPYRYFWVYRDPEPNINLKSFKGYLPVTTADVADPNFHKADGYVLESAGSDRLFGNVWKANPTAKEINDAADNITIMP